MEISGKLVKILELETGTSKAGKEWQKQTVVIDSGDEFNNLTAVSAFGEEKIRHLNKLKEGMDVSILCNIYSREFKGKYYHNIDGYHFTNQTEKLKSKDSFVTTDDDDVIMGVDFKGTTPGDMPF
tara:strand:+ start:532 stop:906 length:375 start_codon:yes stop_codon:yes gene_type:complete